MNKEIQETFKNYPKADKLFVTTDGNIFIDENKAEGHKFNLPGNEREIEIYDRSTLKLAEAAAKAEAEKKAKGEAAKVEAEKKAKEAAAKSNKTKKAKASDKKDEAKTDEKAATNEEGK